MEDVYYQHMAEIQTRHWWYEGRRRIIASIIARLPLPARPKIFEAGCGTGANLNMLKSYGTVDGMEPHDFGREYAIKISGCDIRKGFLPADIPFQGPYDLIGAFDVIEHVGDDRGSLKALHTITAPGGYALFTVPAWMFLWSQHDVINHHKRRYTRPVFVSLLEQAGYTVVFSSYYNFWLFPLIALVRFIKNVLGMKDKPDMTMPPPEPANYLLSLIFSSERFILGKAPLPFGVSIIALCKKAS